jgi:hypothetical protein
MEYVPEMKNGRRIARAACGYCKFELIATSILVASAYSGIDTRAN